MKDTESVDSLYLSHNCFALHWFSKMPNNIWGWLKYLNSGVKCSKGKVWSGRSSNCGGTWTDFTDRLTVEDETGAFEKCDSNGRHLCRWRRQHWPDRALNNTEAHRSSSGKPSIRKCHKAMDTYTQCGKEHLEESLPMLHSELKPSQTIRFTAVRFRLIVKAKLLLSVEYTSNTDASYKDKNGITDAWRLLSIVVHCCPLLSIAVHCCTLLSIGAHCYPPPPRSAMMIYFTIDCHILSLTGLNAFV